MKLDWRMIARLQEVVLSFIQHLHSMSQGRGYLEVTLVMGAAFRALLNLLTAQEQSQLLEQLNKLPIDGPKLSVEKKSIIELS